MTEHSPDLIDLMQAPRARRTDPATSHQAAKAAAKVYKGHARLFLDALEKYGPLICEEAAEVTGAEYHALARICAPLRRTDAIEAAGTRQNRKGLACTVWKIR